MKLYKPFYNDWLNYYNLFETKHNTNFKLTTNLSKEFFENLKLDSVSLKEYRINAALECAKTLGENPALAFSGGIDSQCMVQSWVEAGLKFDLYTLVFNDDLNIQDVSSARNYCKIHNLPLKEVQLDIVKFLTRENYDYGVKYYSASPHFNTHYKFYNILFDMGYTGVCAGGDAPRFFENKIGNSFNRNNLNFINYNKIENVSCQGSFLSFYPELAWAIFMLEGNEVFESELYDYSINKKPQLEFLYNRKIHSYTSVGFNIIPQAEKYTGFELVKKYFEEKTGDGWAFEKLFRHPLEGFISPSICYIDFDKDTLDLIFDRKNS